MGVGMVFGCFFILFVVSVLDEWWVCLFWMWYECYVVILLIYLDGDWCWMCVWWKGLCFCVDVRYIWWVCMICF